MRWILALFFALSCASCSPSYQRNPDVSYRAFQSRAKEEKAFFVFLYAPWCPHCQKSLPLVENALRGRDDWYLLNGEEMTRQEHLSFKEEVLTATEEGDPLRASKAERAFYPTVSYYAGGLVRFAKSGLPKEARNVRKLLFQIESSFSSKAKARA